MRVLDKSRLELAHACATVAPPFVEGAARIPLILSRSLPADEIVLLSLKPSAWFLVLWRLEVSAGAVGVSLGALALSALGVLQVRPGFVIAYALIVLAFVLIVNCLDWLARAYVLTDRRVVRVGGVVRRSVYDVPLARVQSALLHKGVRERMSGCGSIVFSSAAAAGITGEFAWHFIDQPERAAAAVRDAIERFGGLGAAAGAGAGGSAGAARARPRFEGQG
ncbi:hypothetical protein BH11PLA1_BH11PLA1_14350 [soil metagenome]